MLPVRLVCVALFAIVAGCGARSSLPGGGTPAEIDDGGPGAPLDGLRWELPCMPPRSADVCTCDNTRSTSTMFGGTAGQLYQVTLRFRGVVETKAYEGGTNDGAFFQIGGTPVMDNWNAYRLAVASPNQVYYLNRGTSGLGRTFGIDYEAVVPIEGGSALELESQAFDAHEIPNVDDQGNPIVVPGIPPAPLPYDGQFIQVDVLAVN
jgi:hypothetical protein